MTDFLRGAVLVLSGARPGTESDSGERSRPPGSPSGRRRDRRCRWDEIGWRCVGPGQWLAAGLPAGSGYVGIGGRGGGLAGAAGFRWLIFGFTWLATGREQFGQQGRVGSLHLPWLGTGFLLVVPVVGGLLYGPLIQRFAREHAATGCPRS